MKDNKLTKEEWWKKVAKQTDDDWQPSISPIDVDLDRLDEVVLEHPNDEAFAKQKATEFINSYMFRLLPGAEHVVKMGYTYEHSELDKDDAPNRVFITVKFDKSDAAKDAGYKEYLETSLDEWENKKDEALKKFYFFND